MGLWMGYDPDPFLVGEATGWGVTFEGVFDLFAGVFEVAFCLIGLASGFEGLVVDLPCRGLPWTLPVPFWPAFLGLILGTHRAVSFLSVAVWAAEGYATRLERLVVTVMSRWAGIAGLPTAVRAWVSAPVSMRWRSVAESAVSSSAAVCLVQRTGHRQFPSRVPADG